MNLIQDFNNKPFIEALQSFFTKLNVPVNEITTASATAVDIIGENTLNELINEVYAYGIVNDAIFEQNKTFNSLEQVKSLKEDYDGILLFGVTLNPRENNLLPTRNQLSHITRAFNRVFKFTPVTIVFKYGNHIALANTERTQFKQTWRDGEKIGKVSLLRDIDTANVHSGHERILNNLAIIRSGKNAITDFESLYKYWQEVLSVSLLNKEFYKELSHWYFWAIKEVQFPNEPNQIELALDDDAYAEALKEHKGKNVIRLLTRILFIWFIKEKGLIPEDIFDEKEIASKFIDGFTPQKPEGMFTSGKHGSKYYRAILQNLFFATLNRKQGRRKFRTDGKDLNATQLLRYKSYLKDPEHFIQLMEDTVPFMNGGLFECLDKPHPTAKGPKGGDVIIYNDGFSDREDNSLVVPDFLFFDAEEEVDLSKDYGNAKFKKSKTRGLIAILKSYKFTITENTPIDEDVALDPELLGKVFENLLASYNPETKTTARKQTGSFYTPREIVNYMVEESLIAYLKNELLHEDAGIIEFGKNQIAFFGNEVKSSQLSLEQKVDESPFKNKQDDLDTMLHQLVSYSDINPFANFPIIQQKIIKALDNCKILDPACGSGAYPMGILQKMVHILHKIDSNNTEWKQRQIDRVNRAIDDLELNENTEANEKSINELKAQINDIEASFANNELDYGRKLYLVENCIYGVDIQPIATQISKLRFFISLVVDQKVDKSKKDFGIRPLPNLETKFVAANTLIGLDKPKNSQASLFDKREVQKLEKALKKVRHSLFSIKTPRIKRKLREQDKELREQISDLLSEDYGNETARLLANWDPYDQNTSSSFFDKEWMFDITNGFDIVIGNPPYVNVEKLDDLTKKYLFENYKNCKGRTDLYIAFIEKSLDLLKENGLNNFIIPYAVTNQNYGSILRKNLIEKYFIYEIVDTSEYMVFDTAMVKNVILNIQKTKNKEVTKIKIVKSGNDFKEGKFNLTVLNQNIFLGLKDYRFETKDISKLLNIKIKLYANSFRLEDICLIAYGARLNHKTEKIGKENYIYKDFKHNYKPFTEGKNIERFSFVHNSWLDYQPDIHYNSMFPELFENEKIFFINVVKDRLRFAFDNQKYYNSHTVINAVKWNLLNNASHITVRRNITKEKIEVSSNYNYLFLTGILNSNLINWYFVYFLSESLHFYPDDAKKLPIKKISLLNQEPFIKIVGQIIEYKKTGIETLALEQQIDLMVYKLYELSYDEVLIVEPEFSINAVDYENFKL